MKEAEQEGVDYSIVIPVYNSARWLPELVSRTHDSMEPLGAKWELILVNDKSPEKGTWETINSLAKRYTRLRGIDLLYNTGQFRATLCGLEQATGQFIITMDDDFQNPPEEIPKLISAIQNTPDVDCVIGRYEVKKHSFVRNIGSRLVAEMHRRLYGKPRNLRTTSFRIMRAEFARTLCMYQIAHPQLGPIMVQLSSNIINIPVQHKARTRGQSGYRLKSLVYEVWFSVTNSSIMPLRLMALIGLFASATGFVYGLYLIIKRLSGNIKIPGYTSAIVISVFFSGLILMSIGILGEYVGRIIREITGLPRYSIRKTIGLSDTPTKGNNDFQD